MKSRYKIILAVLIAALLFAALLSLRGWENTFRLWNVPGMQPHFADLDNLLSCSKAYSQGFDPMVNNPYANWGTANNYPRVWRGLYLLGINQAHTTAMGIGIILLFLVGICLFLPNASNATLTMILAAILSPAALLCVERANVDLFLFFLVSVAIVVAQRSYVLSALAILFGFVLKFYPIFGLAVLLKARKSKFMLYALISLVLVGCYIFLTFSDILLIKRHMPECRIGYGMSLYWRILGDINVNLGRCSKALSYLLLILSSLFAFSALLRKDDLPVRQESAVYLSAFRAGASIYIGTFLMTPSFPYRLIFLIFTIPQLMLWARQGGAAGISIISKSAIIVVFISMWSLVVSRILGSSPWYVEFTIRAMSNWLVFICLLYLLFWSMPAWVKEMIQGEPSKSKKRYN